MSRETRTPPSATVIVDESDESNDNDDNNLLRLQSEELREHMGLPRSPGGTPPRYQPSLAAGFFIELAPDSSRGSRCRLPTCNEGPIIPGRYRIALNPAMEWDNFMRGRSGSADFYHIRCFEMIADFSQVDYLKRVHAVTRSNFKVRGLKGNSILSGNYLVEGGIERLVLQWRVERCRQIYAGDGNAESAEPMAENFANLLDKAGLPGFEAEKPEGMTSHEYRNLLTILAPNESDGPEDNDVWNLFEQYLYTRKPGSLDNRHDLSDMIDAWWFDALLASKNEDNLSQALKEERDKLGPKAIRALKRMSQIPMPDLQGNFR
ncbi:uncharacterized protein CTRU02_201721 [Colletotrichum truncatum]|uniref:Uncharacterized protein n=1 Tax=Colletotrichum truncatum TaxID=5467 RepID=A0ACC3ZI95_COLTU|nr:uncharacterized protein CTRU02_11607 [Colletotrichum truncatum]KAF6785622.1 hypothetical protein CTRU02_11607 [Colletotrichum truncatum]